MAALSRHAFSKCLALATTASALSSIVRADIYSTKKGPNLTSIESTVAEKLISQHVPGAALVIVKDGKLLDLKCYGYRDFAQMLPVTPLTPFCIGSCTKAFTAMAVEMAVDAGLVSLSDSPSKYLPAFKLKDPELSDRVTLRDFLSKRTGLEEKKLEIDWNDTSPKKMLHVISGERPTTRPKKRYTTDRMNYCVAGWAVAAANGSTYEKLITESIFKPLAMNDSRVQSSIRLAEDARGHILDRNAQPTRFEREFDSIMQPESGIVSSARDMAKWLGLLTAEGTYDGKRLVSERGFQEFLTPINDKKPDYSQELGIGEGQLNGYRLVAHSGGAAGYSAAVMLLPERHLGVVILTNLGSLPKDVEENLPAWVLAQIVSTQS